MKVAFHLRRLPHAEPAVALLFHSRDVAELLALCIRIGEGTTPIIHALADGFLLKLPQPTTSAFPGTLRLRAHTANLYLPVDAELSPTLHEDEASALVRDRGLVFLPDGRILGFATHEPLHLAGLLCAEHVMRHDWRPLPAPRPRAERLRAIIATVPERLPDDFFQEAGQDIGIEEPQLDDAGTTSKLMSKAQLQAGKGMMWLGKMLGIKRLAQQGAGWVQRAVNRVPGLTESLLGKQEAALRALLREFREGNLNKALRRALPLGNETDRGLTTSSGNAHLPFHNLLYSLANLLGSSAPRGIWLGGYDVQHELENEYRKAAEAAAQQGDYRRAAFIYGKLLRDFRSAANVLARGGLHHDAAILYLTKLSDKLAAARSFEAAGEADHALQLYRQCREHVAAGELLKRLGDEEAALVEFQLAAERLVHPGQNYLGAGELILSRTGRVVLAQAYFEQGWAARPAGSAIPCAIRLARLHAEAGSVVKLRGLLGEAEEFLESPGDEGVAGQFYNEVVRLGEHQKLATVRDDLRDHALLRLAAKVRQRAESRTRSGDIVATLLGESRLWPSAVVSDAEHAWKAAVKQATPESAAPAGMTSVQVGRGVVTAAAFAPESGEVVLGFEDGALACYRPVSSEIVYLPFDPAMPRGHAVTSLAVDVQGRLVVALRAGSVTQWALTAYAYRSDGSYEREGTSTFASDEPVWLAPVVRSESHDYLTGVWRDGRIHFLRGANLVSVGYLPAPFADDDCERGLLLRPSSKEAGSVSLFLLCGQRLAWRGVCRFEAKREWEATWQASFPLPCKPHAPERTSLALAPLAFLERGATLDLAALTENGSVCWSSVQLGPKPRVLATNVSVRAEGYLATTIVRTGFVAAVSRSSIDWLRCGNKQFTLQTGTKAFLPSAVACFPSHPTHELIVVCRDGVIVRVPVPN